jgi:glycerol-3-phosphate dehydrogenase
MGGTKGSHIVVAEFEGAPADAVYVEAASDGRPFFIIPWNDQVLIGTTDIRYNGDPADATASDAEIDYLLLETNRLFPKADLHRGAVHFAYAGVRPLPRRDSGPESAITRKHIIKKHRLLARGLVSIIGGKLTTYRNLAEQTVDYVNKKAGMKGAACRTRNRRLPGAKGIAVAARELDGIETLSVAGKKRLLGIYGGRATRIASLARETPSLAETLNTDRSIIAAEVAHVIENEYAVSLVDIFYRRMMLGLSSDQGVQLIEPIATVAANSMNWSARERKSQIDALHAYNRKFQVGT